MEAKKFNPAGMSPHGHQQKWSHRVGRIQRFNCSQMKDFHVRLDKL